MKRILLLAFLLNCLALQAQNTFQVKLSGNGSEEAVAVTELPNGNFVVLSSKYVSGINMDFVISEITFAGGLVKSKTFGTTNGELAKAMCRTSDGNFIIAGSYFSSTSDYDLLVAKIDSSFNTIWVKHLGAVGGNDYVNSVYEISQGRYAVTGTTGIGGSARPSFMILDDNGTIAKEFHLNTNQFASPNYKAVYLNNGTFAFCNLTNSLCIVDTNGTVIKNNSTNFGIYTTDAMLMPGSKPTLIAFSDYGSLQGGTTSLTTFDSTGNTVVASKKFRSTGYDFAPVKVLPDNSGGYIIAANASSLSNGNYTGVIFRADSTGLLQWAKKYTPTGSAGSKINDLKRTADGGFIAVGSEGGASTTILVTKIDSLGFVQCNTSSFTLATASATSNSATQHSINAGNTQILTAINPTLTTLTTGSTVLCTTVGVEENTISEALQLFPNPAQNFISTTLKINTEVYTTIYSAEGKVVSKSFGNLKPQIDISRLPSGLYLYEIKSQDGKTLQQNKFIKE
jgi:Secretion system C-terminal sorting domain